MDYNHLNQTEESLRDADAAARIRARLLIALAGFVILWILAEGLMLYDALPERVPTHFGARGLANAWGPKNLFNVFGLLIVAGVILIVMTLLRLRPKWYNFPGKEKAALLPAERQLHVYAPLQEALSWLGASCAVGLSLLCRQTWAVALHERNAISTPLALVPVVAGLIAVLIGTIVAVRRLRAFQRPA